MKNKLLITICIVVYSSLAISGCDEQSITSRGFSATQAIERTRSMIPPLFKDNSLCTSPIIACDKGFTFDESEEFCRRGTEVGEVIATVAIKAI